MVNATLNYIIPPDDRPRNYMCDPPEGTPWRNYEITKVRAAVEDGRELAEEPTLDTAGIALVRHRTQVADLYDSPTIREHYYCEMEQLVKRMTGAVRVHAFDHNLRSTNGVAQASVVSDDMDPNNRPRLAQEGEDPGRLNLQTPVWYTHNDFTLASGPERLREELPDEAETLLERRFSIVNVWKPIRGPVQDVPLAVLDGRSLDKGDLVASDLVYSDRVGEVYALAFNPRHHWIYYSQMQADEALLFKCYDSDPEHMRFTAHSAFDDPSCPEGALPRESIEVRTLVFF